MSPAAGRGHRVGRLQTPDRQPSTARLVAVIGGTCAALGLLVGVAWSQIVTPVEATLIEGGTLIDEIQSAGWFALDAWFGLLGAIAGLLAGGLSLLRFRARPIAVTVLNVFGGMVGSAVAWQLGMALGPHAVQSDAADEAHIALPLAVHAYGVLLIWPMAALVVILVFNAMVDDRTPATLSS